MLTRTLAILIIASLGLAAPQGGNSQPPTSSVCPSGAQPIVVSETWIGKDKNVLSQTLSCPEDSGNAPARRDFDELSVRQAQPTNVCGANCATNCFLPAGGGPDPNECHVIADALLFESENTGAIFTIGTAANNTINMQFRSCKTFFRNQDVGPLAYCRTDWASLIDWVAPNCQAAQNAHGGNCVANDQRWFVQVQHS